MRERLTNRQDAIDDMAGKHVRTVFRDLADVITHERRAGVTTHESKSPRLLSRSISVSSSVVPLRKGSDMSR
jgi:hypothetical protein